LEFIFEFLAELIGEIVISASTEAIPYEKLPKRKRKKYMFIVAVITAALLISLVVGIAMLLETKGESALGKMLIGFPIVYFLIILELAIRKCMKKAKSKKKKQ
jgi:lysylphosphatidylglycerol synthetase-like protein (DUF2156 family)